MPKAKKKKSGSKGDKEVPLLTVQGVLRLEKSFVTAMHEDADVIKVKPKESEEAKELRLVPGESEHDLVDYRIGYDVGPSNPFPTNEPEKVIYEAQKKADAKIDAFEQMKEQSEQERKERELKFRQENLIPESELKPPGDQDHDQEPEVQAQDPKELDPDNPENYILPLAMTSNVSKETSTPHDLEHVNEEDSQEPLCMDESQSYLVPTMKPLPDEQQFGKDMVLSVALEHEEKRRKKKSKKEDLEGEEEVVDNAGDDFIYSLDEITRIKNSDDQVVQGPDVNQDEIIKAKAEQEAKSLLDAYWKFVNDNDKDFNGWTYLLQHVENIDVLDEIRKAYNDFLPRFRYCFAYWIKYSELEIKHGNYQRGLEILHTALKDIPMSIELWIAYLELYHKMYSKHLENFDETFREQCESAIMKVGMDFRSDDIWERYIEWEHERNNLKFVTEIYNRLIGVPTKLYNKHWDNFIAHVRDHHPRDILDYDNYDRLRKVACAELGLTYRPDPIIEPHTVREVFLPEDKLKAGMKERIVASLVNQHEKCESLVEKRLKFEDKIKRPYFHVKPLDLKQLKNWDSYLDFEIAEGWQNHERIVVLFERCLIPCAKYEQFWAKYAFYMENQAPKKMNTRNLDKENQIVEESILIRKARWSFGTGLTNVDDIRERRCMWTLRGWMETDEEGNEKMVAEPIPQEKARVENVITEEVDDVSKEVTKDEPIEKEIHGTENQHHEEVRKVYRRACEIHCHEKALIHMKWAAFEENCGNAQDAKNILTNLLKWYPLLIEASMQLIDLERRNSNTELVQDLYKALMKKIPKNRLSIKTWLAIKLARFQFKVLNEPKQALKTLQKARKSDPKDARLYTQIIDICYQRTPADITGVAAAIELAIISPNLTSMEKLSFVKKKLELMQEFGDVGKYREATEQLKKYKSLNAAQIKLEAKKRKELAKEELRLKEIEELRAQTRAQANLKAKSAESEGRLMCTQCQVAMYPNAQGLYEFEGFRPDVNAKGCEPEKQTSKDNEVADDGIVDLLDMEIPEDQEEIIKKTLEEKTKYKEVAPTWELNIETYGYGKRRKVYDPDYEHVESAKFREYERLEGDGYDKSLLDPDKDKIKKLHAPGLGHDPRAPKTLKNYSEAESNKFTTSDYVVPPKVPQLQLGPGIGPKRLYQENEEGQDQDVVFELPPDLVNPQKSPCVNVPEWFVKEGGELCLSDTKNGLSIIRYWPKFLSEKGNHLMFKRLRKYCKWHQKQIKIGGEWKYETRLVAWYGPCDYVNSGLELKKNLNWAPELLDLLHRLIGMTRHDFNSCFCNLYRHGHDMCGWHSDVHPQLGRNPPVASVSLGAVRVFEFRKKNGPPNFIRFPLFPGSLLVMEGATQEDWLHCLPRDVNCKEERVNLTFRIMYAVDKRT